ncbi:MAG: hypothetical protein ACKOOL_04155 [Novosphingobium sp.]
MNTLTRLVRNAVVLLLFGLIATPALADKLTFDHRLVPALKAVLDSGDAGMIDYNASNPKNLVDLIAVRGKSAKDWQEALVIIARTPQGKVLSAADWATELQAEARAKCASTFTEIARDDQSVTYERRSAGCPAGYPQIALYRAVGNKRSLFLLAVLVKDDLPETERGQWLALMSSAHIE